MSDQPRPTPLATAILAREGPRQVLSRRPRAGTSRRLARDQRGGIRGDHRAQRLRQEHALAPARRPRSTDRGRGLLPRAAAVASSISTTSTPARSASSSSRSTSCPRSRHSRTSRSRCSRARWSPRERIERAARLIEEVGLADRRRHRPSQLSVGERQRVAIARSLANDPCLLLADEPTGNLDSKSQDEIIHLLHRLRDERQLTLVIVTHSHDVAQAADRRIPMKDGQIQAGVT